MTALMKIPLAFFLAAQATQLAAAPPTGSETLPVEAQQEIKKAASDLADEWIATIETLTSKENPHLSLSQLIQKMMPHGFAKVGDLTSRDAKDPPGRWDIRRRENAAKADRKFVKALQAHTTDHLTHQSFASALESLLAVSPNKLIPLDANHDGKITLVEFAPSSPLTQNEETDSDGFTKNQRKRFATYDDNDNGSIEGAEIITSTSRTRHTMRANMLAVLIHRADLDQDSSLSQSELEKLLPKVTKIPKAVPISEALFWLRRLDSDDLTSLHKKLLQKR